jgi:hypothetical protein
MNMFKKGPEIKLPEMKIPDFLLDLYYDLKERHLLPLAAILVVAIIAAPIALSQSGSEDSEAEAAAEAAIATPSSTTSNTGVLVAKSAPGLRDYRRRLRHMRATDPFKQQYTAEEQEGASSATSSTGISEEESSVTTETTTTETYEPSSTPPSETGGEPVPGAGKLTYFSYAIDVRVVPGGSQEGETEAGSDKATVRRNLPELTMLPSRETPAAVYMGSTKDGKKALMLISSNVEAIFGDGKCVLGSDSCQLLAMEPGVPETFVYGGEGRTFKIELLKVHLVTTDKLNRAPLGKPKDKQKPKKSHKAPEGG